jgi:PAS domain S-box-containing protein
MNKNELENRIKELELELSNLKSSMKETKELANQKEQVLMEINDKFLSLADNISGYIAYVNANTLQYEFVNKLHEKSFGIPKEKIIGCHMKDIIGETNYQFALKYINEVKSGESTSYETTFDFASGKRWLQVNFAPVIDTNGHVTSIAVLNFDITERKQAEKALQESEEKFRSIIENSADAIYIINQQGKYVYTNMAVSVMLGYTSEEMKSKTIADISPPNKIEEYFEAFKQILSEGKGFAEVEFFKKDGNYISADLNSVLLPDGRVYGSCRDITERKRVEKMLKESESALRDAQEIGKMGSWEWDMVKQKTYWSENYFAIHGFKSKEVEPTFELFRSRTHPDDVHFLDENFAAIMKDKTPSSLELRLIQPDGTFKWIQNNIIPVIKDDKLVELKGVIIDITNRKQAELTLKKNEIRLHQLNADKDRFISILSHDLKNPFNNLLGLSEVLTEDIRKLDIDEIETLANQINTTARNTFNLLEDILTWVRAQQGEIPFKPQNLSFTDICKNILETLNLNAKAKNITINCLTTDHQIVFADNDMLKTVMRNLVSNAIKFTNKGGAININAKENPENVTISISDNGIGIKPDDLKKLFNISEFITTTGTAKETGTGLGLLLCKEFVEKHGGKIWVESVYGKGSEFKFTLPVSIEQAEHVAV